MFQSQQLGTEWRAGRLYPWAGALLDLRDGFGMWIALAPIGAFLLILILGLVYEWSKGALDWE